MHEQYAIVLRAQNLNFKRSKCIFGLLSIKTFFFVLNKNYRYEDFLSFANLINGGSAAVYLGKPLPPYT